MIIPQPETFKTAMALMKLLFSMIIVWLLSYSLSTKGFLLELFKSSVIMPVNSSTEGVEGPAVDKAGTLYWVNYEHQGTIGTSSRRRTG